MSEQNMPPRLREGIDAAKRGDKATARRLLQQVLGSDGNNELALMWMASVVDAMEERRFFLERALKVNPKNTRAREALRRLGVPDPEPTSANRNARPADANRAARRTTTAPNTNLYLIAAAIVAVVVIAVIVASAVSTLQSSSPTPTFPPVLNLQATRDAVVLLSQTPTTARQAPPTETLLPGIVVTLDAALVPTLPPTFTPTFTPPPTETPEPTATPLSLRRFSMIYSDVEPDAAGASLFRARADGTGVQLLASGSEGGFNDVAYDAVEQRIAFIRMAEDAEGNPAPEIFIAPLDAPEEAEQLTTLPATRMTNLHWQPNGAGVIVSSNHDGDDEIWLVSAVDAGMLQLTNNDVASDITGQYSPSNSQIAFASDRDSPGFYHIYTMNINGGDVVRLTTIPSSHSPTWSPDGERIAYVNNQQGDDDIYVMDADGQNSILLTQDDSSAQDSAPVWSPDGQSIFFASNRDGGEFRWFAVDLQGNVQPITETGRTPQTLNFITD